MATERYSVEQLAALHDAARRRAHELRQEAIADLQSQAVAWLARQVRRLLPARRSTPCHS